MGSHSTLLHYRSVFSFICFSNLSSYHHHRVHFSFLSVASSSFLSFGKFIKTRKTTIPPSWCAAKEGVADASLQIALDYACGIGGVDCSAIQETGACYNPNTLQDHASYAFNVYYQNKPSLASCDFGGTAVIVYTNPSKYFIFFPF